MQKIIFRPICHMTFQQANSIYQEIRSTHPIYLGQQSSMIQKTFQHSPYSNSIVSNNNPIHITGNNNDKNSNQNNRANRLNSLPQNPQFGMNTPNTANYQNMGQNSHTLSPGQNRSSQKIISKDSIIRKYDDFFGQKVNIDGLKQQNSRLYYEKLALQASVQKLKEQNIKKDHQISRLKQFIQNGKNVHNPPPKPLQGFQSQVVNQPSPQIHFRPNFQQKRPF